MTENKQIIMHGIFSGILGSILLGLLAAQLGSISAKGDPTDVSGVYIIAMPILFGPIGIPVGIVLSFLLLRKSASKGKLFAVYAITFIILCLIRYISAGTIA